MKNHSDKSKPAALRSDPLPPSTDHGTSDAPASILRDALPLLPRGRVLDVAAGKGTNAIFLAQRGWRVTAIDISNEALDRALQSARQFQISAMKMSAGHWLSKTQHIATPAKAGLPLPARAEHFDRMAVGKSLILVEMDLETARLPVGEFQVVLCFRYLQRSLFPILERALSPGGMLIYETYTTDHLQFGTHPRNPQYLLQPGELRQAFSLLEPIFYREFTAGKGIATLIATRPPGRASRVLES